MPRFKRVAMKHPLPFGIYFISENYLQKFAPYDDNLNAGLLKPKRPFVCVYVGNQHEKTPYFVPLFSINPSKSNYTNRRNKWEDFKRLEQKINSKKTLLFFDNPLNKNIKNFISVAVLYKTIPVPSYMLTPLVDNHGKNFKLSPKDSAILKHHTEIYINATKTKDFNQPVPLVGYQKILFDEGKKYIKNYPINHSLLLHIIKQKENRKQNKNHIKTNPMEEKEK